MENKLKELKKNIEEIKITFDYEDTYSKLHNEVIDYMNDTQDFDFEYLFEDYYYYDTVEDIAKQEIDRGGLIRLYYFLGDADLRSDIFRIDGYGNLANVDKDDLECLKDDILAMIKNKEEEK